MTNKKRWLFHNLNCRDTHILEIYYRGGLLQYGTAIGPDGIRSSHTWVLRKGKIIDIFNWTDHEPKGFWDYPSYKDVRELVLQLRFEDYAWEDDFPQER